MHYIEGNASMKSVVFLTVPHRPSPTGPRQP